MPSSRPATRASRDRRRHCRERSAPGRPRSRAGRTPATSSMLSIPPNAAAIFRIASASTRAGRSIAPRSAEFYPSAVSTSSGQSSVAPTPDAAECNSRSSVSVRPTTACIVPVYGVGSAAGPTRPMMQCSRNVRCPARADAGRVPEPSRQKERTPWMTPRILTSIIRCHVCGVLLHRGGGRDQAAESLAGAQVTRINIPARLKLAQMGTEATTSAAQAELIRAGQGALYCGMLSETYACPSSGTPFAVRETTSVSAKAIGSDVVNQSARTLCSSWKCRCGKHWV